MSRPTPPHLLVLVVAACLVAAGAYAKDAEVKRKRDEERSKEVVYAEFDDRLEADILNALCVPEGGEGPEKDGKKIPLPLFCGTMSDNFTDYAQIAQEAQLSIKMPSKVPGEPDTGAGWYPKNYVVGDWEKCPKRDPKENPEFCTLNDLVVIPTSVFANGERWNDKVLGRPNPYNRFGDSFIGQIFKESELGDEDFAPGISLTTESCEQRCREGYQCMPSLELALASQGQLGRCEPCERGTLCPSGTLHDGGLALGSSRLNQCPPGFFCPNSTTAFVCPAGYFCPLGSHKPFSCDGMAVGDNVKLEGNYCPRASSTPFGLCPKGWYCPDSSEAVQCPEGHYCEKQSREPRECPPLTNCPAGSSRHDISWYLLIGLGVLFGGFLIFLLVLLVWIRISQRRVLREARKAEKQSTLLRAIGVKLGLTAEQMSYASHLKGFSSNVRLVDIVVDGFSIALRSRGKTKLILRDVCVAFRASTLNIILGSSGAGKTTFLKALVGKFSGNSFPQGEIRFEFKNHPVTVDLIRGTERRGCACSRSITKLRARETAVRLGVGYVAQDNVVHEILTVHENIAYSARMRLGASLSAKTKQEIIQDTITVLGLNHIQNAKVGNPLSPAGSISGGEARRVSIGLELVACPSLLILDEPTSGLDAVAANEVMSSLNKMSDLGVTVVASLHQPRYSTFLLFDSLHLFMRGGYVVYSGPTAGALPYFTKIGFKLHQNENPADFMLDVIAGLIDLPGNDNFKPMDLVAMWEEAGGKCNTSRSARQKEGKMRSNFDFGGAEGGEGKSWVSQDDSMVSQRSMGFAEMEALDSLEDSEASRTYECADPLSAERTVPSGVKGVRRSASVVPTPRWLGTLGEQFDQLDTKRDGYVDNENMMEFLKSIGHECSVEEAEQLVGHFDVDGDGRIERKDFMMKWTKNYWTREFSTALLGLFPKNGEAEADHVEVNIGMASSRSVEMGRLRSSASSGALSTRRTSSIREMLTARKKQKLALRSSAGFFRQCGYLLQREPLKMMRTLELRVLDFGSMVVIAVCYAFINRSIVDNNLEAVKQANTVAMMFVGVLSSLWATLFISREMPMVQREASEGVSVTAIYAVLNLYNTAVDILIRSLAYSLPFFYITGYNQTYAEFLLITFGTAWSCAGIGMLMASLVEQRSAIVLSVSITFMFGAVLNGVRPSIKELKEAANPLMYWMVFPSYNRWATEALTTQEEMANPVYNLEEKVEMNLFAYHKDNLVFAVLFLYLSGAILRLFSFAFFYKKALE